MCPNPDLANQANRPRTVAHVVLRSETMDMDPHITFVMPTPTTNTLLFVLTAIVASLQQLVRTDGDGRGRTGTGLLTTGAAAALTGSGDTEQRSSPPDGRRHSVEKNDASTGSIPGPKGAVE